MQKRRVYVFKQGSSAGRTHMKLLLGGKGANLCEMAHLGLRIPPGFTITTKVCEEFYAEGQQLPPGLWDEVLAALKEVEEAYGAKFADPADPLLLSVRSGAAVSMPGMMDTVLNLGLNDEVVLGLAAKRGERFAYDSYRRLLDMFGDVVLGIPHEEFEKEIHELKEAKGVRVDVDLTAEDLKEVVEKYRGVYKRAGKELPKDPYEQMKLAICAVFRSWETPRATKYREINRIYGLRGTAVNVQSMVFGNLNDNSGTGVCFTRNPANGKKELYGEYLANAQGEDVVAGIRTPLPVSEMGKQFPEAYKELVENTTRLENYMRDMQDCEFTIQDGLLYMLQTRNGKRTGPAALQVAISLAREGLVTEREAVLMVEPRHLDQLLHPMFEDVDGAAYKEALLGRGLPASPGAGMGRVVFTAEDAEEWNKRGEQVILVRMETSPEDVGGMHAAQGILTARGGMTSHAAVVARGWGKPCVCGWDALTVIDKVAHIGSLEVKEGDWLSVNGTTGEVLNGKMKVKAPELSGDLEVFMDWVDKERRIRVLTNADTPADALVARRNGAQGIGLVRTEHMFFSSPERIAAVRRMIAAEELETGAQAEALAAIKIFQRADFEGIFEAMDGLPVTIRLLDPPLHEFLPHEGEALEQLCEQLVLEYSSKRGQHMNAAKVLRKLKGLNEANPMLGLRGCRLGIRHPDITEMQATAIIEAAVNVQGRGIKVHPHIMVPLVGWDTELQHQARIIHAAAKEVEDRTGVKVDYKVGTMIEVPRGALTANELAKHAQFFSFGTNDLTQMTLGFSRDDAEAKFLPMYKSLGILPCDPFQELDVVGVGELVKIAAERGRSTNKDLELGVCGEHGGDPKSIEFVESIVDYVSCSPLRVPIARLAAAQAAIKSSLKGGNDHCQD